MATEKLRAELEIITAKAEKDLKRLDRSLAGVEKRVALGCKPEFGISRFVPFA